MDMIQQRFKEDNIMKNIHKKLMALVMTLMMAIGSTGVAFAAELPENLMQQEDRAISTTLVYEYNNKNFNKSAVEYFNWPATGYPTLILGGIPTDGNPEGDLTMTIFTQTSADEWYRVTSITVFANGKTDKELCTKIIGKGARCMLTITSTSSKETFVIGQVLNQIEN